MEVIINHSVMTPIYEQIVDQIKKLILTNQLKEKEMLPSVRQLAKDLKISALTVKKAYDELESLGFIGTVHGKGSFVLKANAYLLKEEVTKEFENGLNALIIKAKQSGLSKEEVKISIELMMEDIYD